MFEKYAVTKAKKKTEVSSVDLSSIFTSMAYLAGIVSIISYFILIIMACYKLINQLRARNTTVTTTPEKPKDTSVEQKTAGQAEEKGNPVGPGGIIVLMAYLVLFVIFVIYSLLQLWPVPPPAEGPAPLFSPVIFLRWKIQLLNEVRLILIVVLAGALGSLVHALRSFYWYVGNRELVWSWAAKYLLLPFVGGILGLTFYLVIRGGFFSPQATVDETSPVSFLALAVLAGWFSEEAVLKLKQVAETLLTKKPEGKDATKAEVKAEAETQEAQSTPPVETEAAQPEPEPETKPAEAEAEAEDKLEETEAESGTKPQGAEPESA